MPKIVPLAAWICLVERRGEPLNPLQLPANLRLQFTNDFDKFPEREMGGFNSGRRWDRKLTTSEYGRLEVREWQRRGFLQSGRSFFWPWCHAQVLQSVKGTDRVRVV